MKRDFDSQSGHTLLEMALVMVVASIMVMGYVGYYVDYRKAEARRHTIDAIETIHSAIKQFSQLHERYPCPASPTAIRGDANFGREDCSGTSIAVASAVGVDRDGDGTDDEVLIGAIPFEDLFVNRELVPLTLADTLDGWGNRLTYGVTRLLVDTATYRKDSGAITVMDEYNKPLHIPADNRHYILLSHGPNGVGAYAADGTRADSCTSIVAPPTVPPTMTTPLNERENCDGDTIFMSGLRRDSEYASYDDTLRSYIVQDKNLWRAVGPDMAANTNLGNVAINLGVSTGAPEEKLHVMGHIRTSSVNADSICGIAGDPDTCMPVDVLSGTRSEMLCNNSEAVARIANNRLRDFCVGYRPARPAVICPPGQIMTGYNMETGNLSCVPRP